MPRAVGRKIGFTNRSIWPKYGVHEPIWGTVYDDTLIRAADNTARVALAGIPNPRIEPEICFGLKSTPRAADPESLLAAIDWVAHSIEIVRCDNPSWKVTLAECKAQNALHARLIVGAPVPMTRELAPALPKASLVLSKDGAAVDRGVGANVLDSPLLALGHLVSLLGEPLKPGEIISTGTLTDAYPVAPGETWHTELSGLPLQGLRIRFE